MGWVLVTFFLHPVWGRPSPGHAHPADDSNHEQDLGAGGAGHAHGHFPLLLHWPGERSVGSGWGCGLAASMAGTSLLSALSAHPPTRTVYFSRQMTKARLFH